MTVIKAVCSQRWSAGLYLAIKMHFWVHSCIDNYLLLYDWCYQHYLLEYKMLQFDPVCLKSVEGIFCDGAYLLGRFLIGYVGSWDDYLWLCQQYCIELTRVMCLEGVVEESMVCRWFMQLGSSALHHHDPQHGYLHHVHICSRPAVAYTRKDHHKVFLIIG